jgi:hypothetical protein
LPDALSYTRSCDLRVGRQRLIGLGCGGIVGDRPEDRDRPHSGIKVSPSPLDEFGDLARTLGVDACFANAGEVLPVMAPQEAFSDRTCDDAHIEDLRERGEQLTDSVALVWVPILERCIQPDGDRRR